MDNSADILLFTDNKDVHALFENYLAFGNHFVHFAKKDEDGLIQLSKKNFDIIIFEISQPLLSEISYIEKIHSLDSHVPIVIVSEYFGETRNNLFGNKIAEFVSKPFTMEKLLTSVNSILNPVTPLNARQGIDETTELETKRLSILYEMSKSLNSITDFNLLLKTIINLAIDALDAERATIFIYDRAKNEIWSRVGTGLKMEEIRFPITKGIAGEVIASGYSILTDNPYNHPAFNREFDVKSGFVTRNLLCVPMKNLKGILVGAFQVLNKRGGRFSAQDELFLSAMAASTAIAIENTLLHEENLIKYKEILKLYDDLFIAQNSIVRDTKHATISEIRGYIRELRQYDGVTQIINKIKEDEKIDSRTKIIIDKIEQSYQKMFAKLGGYMNQLLSNVLSETSFNKNQ